MRLNLGAGEKIIPGWTNVDLYSEAKGIVKMDISKMDFADESAEEILAEMVIEHFPRQQVPDVLKEWYRVLKPGGKITIATDNLDTIFRDWIDRVPGYERMTRGIFGKQTDPGQFHYTGFNDDILIRLLLEIGFSKAYVRETDHIYHLWIEAIK